MDHKKIFDMIDSLSEEYVQILADACYIESPTACKERVDECGRFFVAIAERLGWKVEIQRDEDAGDPICITMNPESLLEPICFSGHIDTVHPVGHFKEPRVRIEDNCLYGPGSLDCKGGVVASLLAMHALRECGFTKRPIKLIIQTDEETGSRTSSKRTIDFMRRQAEGAIAFLNTEGRDPGTLVLERKGILRYEFIVRGIAAHSSICDEAANAVTEAAYKIIELEKLKDRTAITCNCGVIKGGTVANSVCDLCTFTADIRFMNDEQYARAERIVQEIAQKTYVKGCSCEAKFVSMRPAMEAAERNFALLERINEICGAVGLGTFKARVAHGGSDAAYITQFGIPCVDSIGVFGGYGHSYKEYAFIDSFILSAKEQAAIAAYI